MNRNVFKCLLIHRLSYKRLWYNRPQCYHSMGYWNKQHLSPIQLRLNHNHMNVFWNVRQYSILNHKYQQHHPYILYPSNGFCCSKILSHVVNSILHNWMITNKLFISFRGKIWVTMVNLSPRNHGPTVKISNFKPWSCIAPFIVFLSNARQFCLWVWEWWWLIG